MKKQIPRPRKSERIDLLKLRNHLDKLDLDNNDNLNFWLYCNIAMLTGLRSVDILKMKVSNISFQNRRVDVIEQKTKRKVENIPLSSSVLSHIDTDCEYVIWNHKYSTNVSLMTINRRLKKIFKDDDIAVSSHSIRKAVGRSIYKQKGNDIVAVMKLLGHKSTTTTMRYLEIDKEELDEMYSLLTW